jgi:hypothetical protein
MEIPWNGKDAFSITKIWTGDFVDEWDSFL